MRNPIRELVRTRWQRHAATLVLALFSIGFVVASSLGTPSPETILSPLLASATHAPHASAPSGYWLVSADGGVFTFGAAKFYGSMAGRHLSSPITGLVPTADRKGYWLVAKDGGVFGFGDADFDGSLAGRPLAAPIVGIATTGGASSSTMTGGGTDFGYFYNGAAQTVISQGDVTFDTNGPSAGVAHALGAGTISVDTAGSYLVEMSVTGAQAGRFALMVNGIAAPGATFSTGAGPQPNDAHVIVPLSAGDVLTLSNRTPSTPVALLAGTVGTAGSQATVNASVLLQRLG